MSSRREAREAVVQFLFSQDIHGEADMNALRDFWKMREAKGPARKFAEPLVEGVPAHVAELDAKIAQYTLNYDLKRIATVDRNILRLAVYEMFHRPDIPPVVSINEAIELAKSLGGEESSRFVNGVLDKIKLELKRPLRTSSN